LLQLSKDCGQCGQLYPGGRQQVVVHHCPSGRHVHEHKVYHLPCDPYYDITKVYKKGEGYVKTVAEAEELGFRWYSDNEILN